MAKGNPFAGKKAPPFGKGGAGKKAPPFGRGAPAAEAPPAFKRGGKAKGK